MANAETPASSVTDATGATADQTAPETAGQTASDQTQEKSADQTTANAEKTQPENNPPEQSPDDLPITDFSKVDLGLPKDAAIDERVLSSFGEQAQKLGLTPNQAKSLAAWQLELAQNARNQLMENGVAELTKDWGNKAKANQQAVMGLISRIDRKLGNDSFSKALDASGATCHAAVCKGLLAIASMLSEDSMGGGNASAMPQKPETALEGLEAAFREMKSKI